MDAYRWGLAARRALLKKSLPVDADKSSGKMRQPYLEIAGSRVLNEIAAPFQI